MSDLEKLITLIKKSIEWYELDPPSNLNSYASGIHDGRIQGLKIALKDAIYLKNKG